MIELLSPAGDFERLKFALRYGADAVYIGGKNYSLRANAINFTNEEIKEAPNIHTYDKPRVLSRTRGLSYHFIESLFISTSTLHPLWCL